MNVDDDFFDMFDDFDDASGGWIGQPNNETNGAIVAMLQEHVIDHETSNKWLLGIMLIAINKVGASRVDLEEALSVVPSMTSSQVAIAGFEAMNVLMHQVEKGQKRGRRSQR
jgi:hypothetical protein